MNRKKPDEFINDNEGDLESGRVLSEWLHRCGVQRSTILNEINKSEWITTPIGMKSFQQWSSYGESAKKISGSNNVIKGERLVAIVKWFFNENEHRTFPVINLEELNIFLSLYKDIPIKNRLQLQRILHDLEIKSGKREINLSLAVEWKNFLNNQMLYAYVIDDYWCLRAATSYELALSGFNENDLSRWSFWHRITSTTNGIHKFAESSPIRALRGCYADSYYKNQMSNFKKTVEKYLSNNDERMRFLIQQLMTLEGFDEYYEKSSADINKKELIGSIRNPIPFFRSDDTLLWLMEFRTEIPNSNKLRLIIWLPMDEESNLYLGELAKKVDDSKEFSKSVYFIEDYASGFSEDERKALGL